ncbi:transposase [Parafrankia soli]|uniref:Transposase n=1 Tax=Parafrankia soli TaxID=2599596 RepID=A0A1S1PND5_9ACTN|nr:IS200/IS605 family transposase [Parafrankia soli]OHV22415.1 transposase [Parafrankia soli]
MTAGDGDLGYHVVWCLEYRRPVLAGPVGDRCDELIRQMCAEHDGTVVALEVMPGQVHLFVEAHPEHSPSYVANQVKGLTSRVLRGEFPYLRSRLPALWSRSYVAATFGTVRADTARRYVDTRYGRPWRVERTR